MEDRQSRASCVEQAFQVFVRIRPIIRRETDTASSVRNNARNSLHVQGNEIIVQDPYDADDPTKGRVYRFDQVFTQLHNNRYVFDQAISPLLSQIINGINATCFAYGMTGAGKTHTMLGDIYNSATGEAGICAMAIEGIFGRLATDVEQQQQYVVKMSYLEIYNERVIDLLGRATSSLGLLIVEDPIRGVTVPDLAEFEVHNSKELLQLIFKGNLRRTMAETTTNQFSSRSHAIMQIAVESKRKTATGFELSMAKLSLVDLAGSERAATCDSRGLRMLEGGKINRSLLALGNCINILSDKTKAGISFVPYRDSKLTRLLKDSLGGNTKTAMIACITPEGATSYDENLNTLKYAERAKKIKKAINKNIREVELHAAQYKEIIETLKSEIASLKEKMLAPSSPCEPVIVSSLDPRPVSPLLSKTKLVPSSLNKQPGDILSLRELEQEIVKTKVLKDKFQEELTRESEEAVVSLKASRNSLMEDDSHLYKLSQELLSKYEEHYEMRQSVQELSEMNGKNAARLAELQSSLDECVKAKIVEDLPREQAEKIETSIGEKAREIESLHCTIDSNENIRKQLEASLVENAAIQQKYLALVVKLQSHKKKDVLELQIAVRSLRLEKMDLMMQNLEMKRVTKLAELANEGKDKKITEMAQELERVKSALRTKEAQLRSSQTRISTQKQELNKLKSLNANRTPIRGHKSEMKASLRVPKRLASNGADGRLSEVTSPPTTGRFLTLSFSRPGECKELRKERVLLDLDDCEDQNSELPAAENKDNEIDRDESFISLSSVTLNCEEGSRTDIELADTCGMIPSGRPENLEAQKPLSSANCENSPVKKTPLSCAAMGKPGFNQRSGSLNEQKQRKELAKSAKSVKSAFKEENKAGKQPQRKKCAGYFSKVKTGYTKAKVMQPSGITLAKPTRNVVPPLLVDRLINRPATINMYNITRIQHADTVNVTGVQSVKNLLGESGLRICQCETVRNLAAGEMVFTPEKQGPKGGMTLHQGATRPGTLGGVGGDKDDPEVSIS